jgi:ribosomal protein S13
MINQKHLDETQTLRTFFIKAFWGFKNHTLNYFCFRFECGPRQVIGQLHPAQRLFVVRTLHKIVPPTAFLKEQFMLNIIFKDLLQSYQGWRHFKGYPVNGQRT